MGKPPRGKHLEKRAGLEKKTGRKLEGNGQTRDTGVRPKVSREHEEAHSEEKGAGGKETS